MVRRIILSISIVLAVGCQTTSGYSPARDLEILEFHSAIWVNLHHYLYNEAFRPQAHQEPFTPFESSEKEQVEKAVAFYKTKFDGRDLLFDKGLRKINDELASAENRESLRGLDIQENGLSETLETVRPVYLKRFWEKQNQENIRWIADVQAKLKLYGAPIKARLEEILNRKFTDGPYRIDVVHEANWAGGYTYTPPHSVLSSGRKTYSEYSALEMIFHETLHAGPFETVANALEKELASHQLKDDDQLWHALHFFTAGEVTREVLKSAGIEYVPYAYANKLFSDDRKWGKFEPLIRKFWLPYMYGQVDMGTALKNIVGSLGSMKPNYKSLFEGRDACFLLAQLSTGKIIEEYNPKQCAKRFSPCSSFKIAASLMGFETGVLKEENQIIPWDGTHYSREELNQNQTPLTWMERSVVWVTQWMTPQIKPPRINKFLKDFSYGNRDFSGGVTQAWLDSTLKISGHEQLEFLTKLWKESLPLSKSAFEKTKKIIFIKQLGPASELYGKTGTGCIDKGCFKQPGRMLGWFVGAIKTDKDSYVFVANAADIKPESSPAGLRLRKDLTHALAVMDLK